MLPVRILLVRECLAVSDPQNSFFWAPQVRPVLFVLLARVRHDFGILARDGQRYRPRLGEEFWILKRDSPFDVVIVDPLKSFDEMQLVAMLMACGVEPGPIVQPYGVHCQSVSIPFAD